MKKLFIFDCDGTLVDSEIIAVQVFPQVWSTMGLQISEEFFLKNFVGTASDADIVKSTLSQLSDAAKKEANQIYEQELEKRLQPVSGIPDLLQDFTAEMCVASNSSPGYLNRVLTSTGLLPFFDKKVFSAYQVPRPKPAPDLFLHASQTLGFDAADCVVIEDSAVGILAAKNSGMKVIGFMGGLHFTEPLKDKFFQAQAHFYCSNTAELQACLKAELSLSSSRA